MSNTCHWWIIDAPAHWDAHTLIVLVGVALMAAWVWRASHLTEEMDDYQKPYQWLIARRAWLNHELG